MKTVQKHLVITAALFFLAFAIVYFLGSLKGQATAFIYQIF